MRSILPLLFWATYLATIACAAPVTENPPNKPNDVPAILAAPLLAVDDEATRLSSSATNNSSTVSALEGSIQIIFRVRQDTWGWSVYQGPQGVSANPCPGKEGPFTSPRSAEGAYETRRPLSIDNPPFPRAGFKWALSIPPLKNCRYESDPNDSSPGQLVCGERSLIYDFLRDPSWERDGVIACPDWPYQYHRAWYVEY